MLSQNKYKSWYIKMSLKVYVLSYKFINYYYLLLLLLLYLLLLFIKL